MLRTFIQPFMALAMLCSLTAWANSPAALRGKVLDKNSGEAVASAIILVEETGIYTYSNEGGEFELAPLPAGKFTLQINRLGYRTVRRGVDAESAQELQVELLPQPLQVEDIVIAGSREDLPFQAEIMGRDIREKYPRDVGEFLKSQPGFAAVRKGGYAIDPVMRSFKYEQLNVQFDGGTRVSHACPNRMDPVTTHVQAEDLEKIEIIKGPYAVRFGQTMGGVVNLVLKRPEPGERFRVHADLESGYEGNGEGTRARMTLAGGGSFYDLYFSGGSKEYQNYRDGSGQEVPSSFRVIDYSLKVGLNPLPNQRLQVSWRQSFARDMLTPGLAMDADEDNTSLWAVDYAGRNFSRKIFSLSAKLYGSRVDHLMSNSRRPNYRTVHSVSEVNAKTLGGRVEIGLNLFPNNLWYLGGDVAYDAKDGNRQREVYVNPCTGMMFNPPMQATDPVWQNSELNDVGIFSEWRHSLSPKLILAAGMRADFISSEAKELAPQFLAEYGEVPAQEETNFSATVSLNYQLNSTTALNFAAGRGTRTANLIERYINHLNVGMDPYEYFGNPFLKPEVNQQAEISLDKRFGNRAHIKAGVFYSLVNDYITAAVDEALPRLYMPCMAPKFTKRYLNIDRARQVGFEAQVDGKLYRGFSYRAGAAYTRADNLEWDQPLPEIPPLEGQAALRYTHISGRFWAEVEGRFVAEQNRVSSAFGESATPDFTVYNLLAGLRPFHFLELDLGVQNIFDKTYYEHLNRRYNNMPEPGMLYEPGRNVTLRVRLHY